MSSDWLVIVLPAIPKLYLKIIFEYQGFYTAIS